MTVEHRTRSWYLEQIQDELGLDTRNGDEFLLREIRVLYEHVMEERA